MNAPWSTLLVVALSLRASCHEPPPETASSAPSASEPPGGDASAAPSDGAARAHVVPDEIAARHILVMYRGSMRAPEDIVRTRDDARGRAAEALRRARAGEDFIALVRQYSDEPGAGSRHGSLGRFGRGVMDPIFERAAFALNPGDLSEVVETRFGFHVIQRTE